MNTESNRLELKRELTDKFERSVVAFLNYAGGGEILLGIDDNGVTTGLADADGDQRKIVDRIKNNIRPATLGLFDVIGEQRDGRDIIRVVVSGGQQRPYYLKARGMTEDGCFIRVGSSVQPMTERMIETLLAKRQPPSLQTMRSPRQNLTFRQLKIYYEEKKLPTNDEFLRSLELVDDDGVFNYAAYMFADDNGVSIKVAKYAGTDKYELVENEEYGNRCLLTATHRVLERLEVENRTFAKIGYPRRIEKSMVDKAALREAIINAIVHNDYSLTVPLVEIFSDRITVTSAGGLVSGLSQKDFFNCLSMPRNRVLMRVFRDVELVESLGSGMTRILNAYDRSIFDFTPSFLVVTFKFAEELHEKPVSGGRVRAESRAESGAGSISHSLEHQIIKTLMDEPLSKAQITKSVGRGIVSGRINRLVSTMLAEEIIEYTIPEKPNSRLQKYRITKKGRVWLKKATE